jgi:hypothetical protein
MPNLAASAATKGAAFGHRCVELGDLGEAPVAAHPHGEVEESVALGERLVEGNGLSVGCTQLERNRLIDLGIVGLR